MTFLTQYGISCTTSVLQRTSRGGCKTKQPTIFDISWYDCLQPTDFFHEGEFSLEQYCTCLLYRLYSLDKLKIKSFIAYHHNQVSDPLAWLNTLQDLLDLNKQIFSGTAFDFKTQIIISFIQVLTWDIENKRSGYNSRFDFEKVRMELKNYKTAEEEVTYLLEMKAEFLRNKPPYIPPGEIPFDQKIDIEIQKIRDLNTVIGTLTLENKIRNRLAEDYMENEEFLFLMKISKRTAASWRESGIIKASTIGAKVYYKITDVEELFKKNYGKTLNRNKS